MSPMTLGERIRAGREKKKLSVRKMAKQLGFSHQWLSDIELDKVAPSLKRLHQIADVLEVSPGRLLRKSPKPAKDIEQATNGHKE